MDNMLWRSVCVTDPGAVKPISGKQYKGNSQNPIGLSSGLQVLKPLWPGLGSTNRSERFERFGDSPAHRACEGLVSQEQPQALQN